MLYKHDALYSEYVFSPILVIINIIIIIIIINMYSFMATSVPSCQVEFRYRVILSSLHYYPTCCTPRN